jgi:hypothetical protein
MHAAKGEVERIGIHDCSFLACPYPHFGGHPFLGIEDIISAQVAEQAANRHLRSTRLKTATATKRLRANKKWKASSARKMVSRPI